VGKSVALSVKMNEAAIEAGTRAAEFAEEAKEGTAKVMKSVEVLKELVDKLSFMIGQWRHVIFSDETSVQLGGVRGRRRV
jgi:hypothetical protein